MLCWIHFLAELKILAYSDTISMSEPENLRSLKLGDWQPYLMCDCFFWGGVQAHLSLCPCHFSCPSASLWIWMSWQVVIASCAKCPLLWRWTWQQTWFITVLLLFPEKEASKIVCSNLQMLYLCWNRWLLWVSLDALESFLFQTAEALLHFVLPFAIELQKQFR